MVNISGSRVAYDNKEQLENIHGCKREEGKRGNEGKRGKRSTRSKKGKTDKKGEEACMKRRAGKAR
jgi:hypothetical protein